MQPAEPIKYTHISQDSFDRLKNILKGKGGNINGNKDNITLDSIPVAVEYDKDKKDLILRIQEPFWLAPGLVAGFFHQMVAQAVADPADPYRETPKGQATPAYAGH